MIKVNIATSLKRDGDKALVDFAVEVMPIAMINFHNSKIEPFLLIEAKKPSNIIKHESPINRIISKNPIA